MLSRLKAASQALLSLVFLARSFAVVAEAQSKGINDWAFEQDSALSGWEVTVYGAPSTVELDGEIAHSGQHSLRLSAARLPIQLWVRS